ncbi:MULTISPECIES: efflux transporter outer membrane subunit [Methylosinus]|uniref:Secretion protein n=1 Tax=Methylosinus trichosporium (strain ATCC 35070 / NCIMB 11131 / UNIQEM 75 / OB3b) TaxID=595536 RepID=A0A2D2CZL5_METT3|nr:MULTISPECIES: efflux transporter outer membrane subunit [Methylosinus]ATQ68144.1 secretion protein [Methylosinus trichosporium OB3b]OBS53531.1 secretion protein [Methylosinus sp. 3S-1]
MLLPSRTPWSRAALLLAALGLSGCDALPAVDLAPEYQPPQFVVPESWRGTSPFTVATPSDGEVRMEWWKLFRDSTLDDLESKAMAANPDLQAAAERFTQARDIVIKTQSRRIPHLGVAFGASDDKQSDAALFRGPLDPTYDRSYSPGGLASWEPDFWSAIRNATRATVAHAQGLAADYFLARLSLQAEIASDYFVLRGYDAQSAIYRQSIAYYKKSLEVVNDRFKGKLASELDVARAQSLLYSTEAKAQQIEADREVTEHALAILTNTVPASLFIARTSLLRLHPLKLPRGVPANLLERRPDVAGAEREMARANREIGIARAAFFPNVVFRLDGGFENNSLNLFKLAHSYWTYGSTVSMPLFEGGLRRAQLQQSWAAYRETEDKYRSVVLNAFREVENGLSLTNRLDTASRKQDAAVAATEKTQNLTMELYKGGLVTSLDLIYAQVATLTARIDSAIIKTRLLGSTVGLVRALGGGWSRKQLPTDEQIPPIAMFQTDNLTRPATVNDIGSATPDINADNNLTRGVSTKTP